MKLIATLFSRRWLVATALVIAAVLVMARLGVWQLDRLAARRAFNARVNENLDKAQLELTAENLDLDLYKMEYRSAVVSGGYLPEDEIVLRNQAWQGQVGFTLFTPLLIEGSDRAILVERGWIPDEHAAPPERDVYQQEGTVTVEGMLRRAETDFSLMGPAADPTLPAGQERRDAWNRLDLDLIDAQTDVDLLPVYLHRTASGESARPPYAYPLSLDLSEGSHLGYAGQWFLFAAILALGYPVYVYRQESDPAAIK